MALTYKEKLERLEPNVNFLMTLYLSPQLTVEEVEKAKAAGIVGTDTCTSQLTLGVKSYPKYCFNS
jgi:dihydroorotase